VPVDEYGHSGRTGGVHWATEESVLPISNLHISNTKVGPGGSVSFWLFPPRPKGYTPEEWEQVTQDRWNRIFPKKE
jgi:hypothetical protein